MKAHLTSFASGVLFAIGLAVAGMTEPSKVVGFLDFFGAWDPSLALVMVGAIGVNLVLFRLIQRRERPRFAVRFYLPTRRDIDVRLVGGAAIFGAGWGLSGFCPAPSLMSVATGNGPVLVFVATMAAGMFLHAGVERLRVRRELRVAQAS